MKKILSALISIILLIGAVGITPVMAIELPGTFTFIDTCYSPQKNLYVAIVKDLKDTANTPAKVIASTNGYDWEITKDKLTPAKHFGHPETRQVIVWWEAEEKFVMSINNRTLISDDARNWVESPNAEMAGANTTVETNGKQLALAAGATVKVFDSMDSPAKKYPLGDAGAISKTIGLTPKTTADESMMYAVGDQYKTWYFNAAGVKTTQTQNISVHPVDMAWSDAFDGWVLVNKTPVLRILNRNETPKYTSFSVMKLSDGTDNTEKFTGLGVGKDNVVVGTENGRMLVAPHDISSLTVDVPWIIAEGGNGSECNEEVRSITEVNDGMFLVASEHKLFMLMEDGDGVWRFYDTAKDGIELEETRFEIPASGTFTTTLNPMHYNYKGEPSEDEIAALVLMTERLPEGITCTQASDTSIQLSIDSTATGGHELSFTAMTKSGKQKEFTVTVVNEDHIEITGRDRLAVPLTGEEAEKYEYTVEVIGTDGEKMSRETAINVDKMPDGAVFDDSTKTFIIDSSVKSGELVFTGYSKTKPDNKLEKTVSVEGRAPEEIVFNEPQTEVFIPDEGTGEFAYAATVYDQIEKEIKNVLNTATNQIVALKLDWTVEPKDIESMNGITIDKDTGVLSVDHSAVMGTITIKAEERTTHDTAELDVTISYTDLRMAKEDLSEFTIDTTQPVTQDINLIKTGKFESEISWRSSDEDIIKTDGKVIRPSREDKKVTITGTSKKNSASTSVKYELVVTKADNLCTNGDLADGTYTGWTPMTETLLSIVKDGEDNVLNVNGKGAYQVITFTNDSSYAFKAKVKAQSGAKIKLVSQKCGTITEITANGDWQDIAASYDFRKQKKSFDDNIYIECSSGLQIKGLTVWEITLELNEVASAVNRAVYTKNASDINAAKALLDKFYAIPIRNELYKKVNQINSSTGGTGGGSGGSAPSKKNQSPSDANTNTPVISIPVSVPSNDNTADELDTFLLRFKDMKNHWARADVEYMAELGIVNGDENDIFRPDDSVSRAEFATMITLAMGQEAMPYENSFFDIISEDCYSGYVQTVKSNDYMSGYDGLFKPNDAITREELARVIVSAYNSKANTKLQTGKTLYFNDIDDISYWAYDYIVEAADMGFIYGITDELFAPKLPATRAQAAVMLKRVYDKLNPSA